MKLYAAEVAVDGEWSRHGIFDDKTVAENYAERATESCWVDSLDYGLAVDIRVVEIEPGDDVWGMAGKTVFEDLEERTP